MTDYYARRRRKNGQMLALLERIGLVVAGVLAAFIYAWVFIGFVDWGRVLSWLG